MKTFLFTSAPLFIASVSLFFISMKSTTPPSSIDPCTIYGKIKFVEYGEDYKVKFVDYGEDLKVKYVDYGEDKEGRWKTVDYGEKVKIKVVDYGEDFKVKEVEYNEGC